MRDGSSNGTTLGPDGLRIAEPAGTRSPVEPSGGDDDTYEFAQWTSPPVEMPASHVELIASWNALTPPGTWLEVAVEVTQRGDDATTAERYVVGRWAERGEDILRRSLPHQPGALAQVDVDRLITAAAPISSWRLEVTLLRRRGTTATPIVTMLGAMTSQAALSTTEVVASRSTSNAGTVLDVPTYSQTVHLGEYPEYDSGGGSWCSPTSTAMILHFWGRGPSPAEYAWVDRSLPDRWVVHAAAATYDHSYSGCGNWSFNTAYAGTFGLHSFVTRLTSLNDVERFIDAGIPVVVSASFTDFELEGAGYDTQGHVLVVVGFTPSGDIVCNDPASHLIASNGEVRTTYDRGSFERSWLAGSGGICYVIHPVEVALPERPAGRPAAW